eukprot:CFRG3929T1
MTQNRENVWNSVEEIVETQHQDDAGALILVKPVVRATVILALRENVQTADEHTTYKVLCERAKGEKYVILKRYSEFFAFRTKIMSQRRGIRDTALEKAIKAFPPRRYFKNLSDEVVSERITALNAFLSLLLEVMPTIPKIDEIVADFLHPVLDVATVKSLARTSAEVAPTDEPCRRSKPIDSVPEFEVQVKLLPLYLYLFNPWSETAEQLEGKQRMPYGRLYVHVVGASGLLASDFAMFSQASSDPYVCLELGAVKKETARTRHIKATLNPHWDEEFVMNVWRPRSKLTLKVYDSDVVSRDDHIGEVTIPVDVLRDQELHDLWFDLRPEPRSTIQQTAKCLKIKTHLGRIRCRLQYKYSALGEYLAHFQEKEKKILEPFDVHICYDHIQRTIALSTQLVDGAKSVVSIITWETTLYTLLAYFAFVFVCLRPRFFVPVCHIPFIVHLIRKGYYRYLLLKYTEYGSYGIYGKRFMTSLPSAADVGLMSNFVYGSSENDDDDDDAAVVKHSVKEIPADVPDQSFEDDETNGFGATGTALNGLCTIVPSLRSTLQRLQAGIANFNEDLDDIYKVFDWTNAVVSRDVLIGLIVSAILTSFIDLRYLILVAGTALLFCTSDIGKKVIQFIVGLVKYAKTRRYQTFISDGTIHTNTQVQSKIYRELRKRSRQHARDKI